MTFFGVLLKGVWTLEITVPSCTFPSLSILCFFGFLISEANWARHDSFPRSQYEIKGGWRVWQRMVKKGSFPTSWAVWRSILVSIPSQASKTWWTTSQYLLLLSLCWMLQIVSRAVSWLPLWWNWNHNCSQSLLVQSTVCSVGGWKRKVFIRFLQDPHHSLIVDY